MRPRARILGVVFAAVVLLSLAQVAWWVFYQFRETSQLEAAAQAYARGDAATAMHSLGIGDDGALDDRFRRRRLMFATEGAFLGLCALLGVVFFYTLLLRERRLLRERERFLAGATHEFKTPLATIRLGLETMLAARVPPAKQAEYLLSMSGEVDRLERGIGNMLAAAGLRSSGRKITLREGDLIGDIEDLLEEFRPRFEAAGIEFTADMPESLPMQRDQTALRIVLHNLLDNALRYNATDDRVRLVVDAGLEDDDRVEIGVEDSGPGMKKDELRRVFQPFFRGSGAEHRGGSGLGLHLVREFVEMHGGSVEALSDGVGTGTTFRVTMPRRCRRGACEQTGAGSAA